MNISLIQAARKLVKDYGVKGELLRQAIPYLDVFNGKTFVLKVGGSILDSMLIDDARLAELVSDITFLKAVGINIVIVHGGGKLLDVEMNKQGIQPIKKKGLRVTSLDVAYLAKKVFHQISTAIVSHLENSGYQGIIFQSESQLVQSKQLDSQLQAVGIPKHIDNRLLLELDDHCIPVVSAITASYDGLFPVYNVNADDVASHIAASIKAEKLILMTDVEGVLDNNQQLLSVLTPKKVAKLIDSNVISGGMLPKVNSCVHALNAGVTSSHIIKGDHQSFMDEILTDAGVGTQFVL